MSKTIKKNRNPRPIIDYFTTCDVKDTNETVKVITKYSTIDNNKGKIVMENDRNTGLSNWDEKRWKTFWTRK
jgi:hypothetical protein